MFFKEVRADYTTFSNRTPDRQCGSVIVEATVVDCSWPGIGSFVYL